MYTSISLDSYPLQAGTYYLKVYPKGYYSPSMANVTYSLKFSNATAPGDFEYDYKYESELNESYKLTTSLTDGDYGAGQLLNSSDTDIYDFTVEEADDFDFAFIVNNFEYMSYSSYIDVKLLDSKFQPVADLQNIDMGKQLMKYHLEAGHYYIEITSNNFKPMMPFLLYIVAYRVTPDVDMQSICMANLRSMDGLIMEAEANGDTISSIADLVPKYLNSTPVCPAGGTYAYVAKTSSEGAHFTCSVAGHSL